MPGFPIGAIGKGSGLLRDVLAGSGTVVGAVAAVAFAVTRCFRVYMLFRKTTPRERERILRADKGQPEPPARSNPP
jgi:hypothetical protein